MKQQFNVRLVAAAGSFLAGATLAQTPSATVNLAPVVITGKARSEINLIDRKVYKVGNDVQATTGNAAELLNSLPSVAVDSDGKLSLRGDTKVLILIDGKPSALLSGASAGDGLLQMAAGDIERVEVMTNPPAQYRAEGTGGVINLITKKAGQGGSTGSIQASLGNRRRAAVSTSGAWQVEAWSLSGGLGLREDDRQRSVVSSLVTTDVSTQTTQRSEQRLNEHLRRLIPSAKGSLVYRVSEQESVSLDLNLRMRDGERYFDQHNETANSNGALTKQTDRHSDGRDWSRNSEQTLRWERPLRTAEETVVLTLQRSLEEERERYAYLNRTSLPVAGQSVDHLYLNHDLLMQSGGLDIATTLASDAQLKFGGALQRDDNTFYPRGDTVDAASGAAVNNPNISNQFQFHQRVVAAYASWQQMLGDWTLLAGVRGEQTQAHGEQLNTGERMAQGYGGLYPSLRLSRNLTEAEAVTLGYGRRLSRPDPESLNPFIDHQDIHNLRAGNPNLLPQDTQSLEAAYRVDAKQHSHGVTAYWRRTRNSVTDIVQVLSSDVTVATKVNLPLSKSAGLEFSTDGPLAPALAAGLTYKLSGNLFHQQIDATALGSAGLQSTSGLNLKANLDWRPSAADTLQLSFSRADKRLTPQGSVAAINIVNFGVRHVVDPQLSLVFTAADLFNGQRFIRESNTDMATQRLERQQAGRSLFIGVIYALGTPKKAKAGGFDFEQ